MTSSKGESLPKFLISDDDTYHKDLFSGGVISVHGVWSMQVYLDDLEYKGKQIRGKFRYKILDHFGLDVKDISHNLPSIKKSF